ncbi:MAG: hypothetical protein WBG02_03230 [Candidatus Acidiferrum sp.]
MKRSSHVRFIPQSHELISVIVTAAANFPNRLLLEGKSARLAGARLASTIHACAQKTANPAGVRFFSPQAGCAIPQSERLQSVKRESQPNIS